MRDWIRTFGMSLSIAMQQISPTAFLPERHGKRARALTASSSTVQKLSAWFHPHLRA